jgi:hypothetical protein
MIINRQNTWPKKIRALLCKKRRSILKYLEWERDHMVPVAGSPYIPPMMRPRNLDAEDYNSTVQLVEELLSQATVRGWHCTRLTDGEVGDIKSRGLQPLNSAHLKMRIRKAQADGCVSKAIAARLMKKHDADEQCRAGMIWFICQPPRAGDGTQDFFDFWGGEALYMQHQKNTATYKALLNIGRPRLIVVNVPVVRFHRGYHLSKMVILHFAKCHGFKTSEQVGHEDYTTEIIEPKDIVRIITHAKWGKEKLEFERMTQFAKWKPPGRYVGGGTRSK